MEQTNNSTAALLASFQAGNTGAFSKLYDTHVNILFYYGLKLTNDKELLKDCIHDIFVRIYAKREELVAIDNFRSYLFISLKNKLCDELRRRMNMPETDIEEVYTLCSTSVEEDYMAKELFKNRYSLVERSMHYLTPRQREAITLYYMEDKKYEDICEIMNLNYQSVRNLMFRGLAKLRDLAC